MSFVNDYLIEASQIIQKLDKDMIETLVEMLYNIKKNKGRVFFIGVGGSAANCSHAVNDFRKIAKIECYAPTDNVSELTARTNDEGWDTIFSEWLEISNISSNDLIFVLSVGGGDLEKNISPNIVKAINFAIEKQTPITGIIGRNGGYVNKVSKNVLVIPTINEEHITPHSESFQSLIWHLIVSHPKIKLNQTKWENQV